MDCRIHTNERTKLGLRIGHPKGLPWQVVRGRWKGRCGELWRCAVRTRLLGFVSVSFASAPFALGLPLVLLQGGASTWGHHMYRV